MTIGELRDLLETLDTSWDGREVVVSGHNGLCHISTLTLERSRGTGSQYHHLVAGRLNRKLRIQAGYTTWDHMPPQWVLKGPWPEAAGDIGIDRSEP